MKTRGIFWGLVLALTLLRLWLVMAWPITEANAYFFACAENPAVAYFDGPPGTALLVAALLKIDSFWWMALGPLWALAATFAAAHFGARVAGVPAGRAAALGLNALPLFNTAALACGPDLPALTLALVAACKIWDASKSQHGGRAAAESWFLAALAAACACLFAYWAAAAVAGGLLAALIRPGSRKSSKVAGAALVVVACAATLAWPMAWNAGQEWIPVGGWTVRALARLDAAEILLGLWALGVALSPLMALAIVWSMVRSARESVPSPAASFVFVAALPGVLLAAFAVYRDWPQGGPALWASTLLLIPLAEFLLGRFSSAWWILVLSGFGFSVQPVVVSAERPSRIAEAARHVVELDARLSPEVPGGLFFIASNADLASALGFHLRDTLIPPPGHPRCYVKESQNIGNQYALWPSYDDFVETEEAPDPSFEEQQAANPFVGRSAIYVGPEVPDDLPQAIRGAFGEVQLVQEAAGYFIYLCLNYQTLPL